MRKCKIVFGGLGLGSVIAECALRMGFENLREHLTGADIAVNAIDFATDAPLVFDDVCFELDIPSVHPYNLGYGGLACVFTNKSLNLRSLSNACEGMEVKIVNHTLNVLNKSGYNMSVFKNVLSEYIAEQGTKQPPYYFDNKHNFISYENITNKSRMEHFGKTT